MDQSEGARLTAHLYPRVTNNRASCSSFTGNNSNSRRNSNPAETVPFLPCDQQNLYEKIPGAEEAVTRFGESDKIGDNNEEDEEEYFVDSSSNSHSKRSSMGSSSRS